MFKKTVKITPLEAEIARVLSELEGHSPDTKEYNEILDKYERLTKLLPKRERAVSGDAILGASVNLLGIGAVLGYEKFNVITSKAFTWIKPRNII